MKPAKLILIGIVAAVQLAVPASMLWGRERTLREGALFRFQTAPVDPYDAFRGRYVALSAGSHTAEWTGPTSPLRRSTGVFVTLGTDSNGFAETRTASLRRPASGSYIRATAWGSAIEGQRVNVRLPIERFYLPEAEAPAAEIAYREHSRRGRQEAVVLVRVRSGDLVVEDLLVEETPIRVWLAEQARISHEDADPSRETQ